MAKYVLKAEGVHYHLSPYAFVSYAEDFYDAAISHDSNKHFSPVSYYLICHSIELLLKAFLLLKGVSRGQLRARDMGHNLVNILDKCKESGLSEFYLFDETKSNEILKLNEWYCRKGFEYFELQNLVDSHQKLPSLPTIKNIAAELINCLKEPCLNEANKP